MIELTVTAVFVYVIGRAIYKEWRKKKQKNLLIEIMQGDEQLGIYGPDNRSSI